MAVTILHLSDIHIKNSTDTILSKHAEVAACVYSSLPDSDHVFIVVSGDIAFSGKEEQYTLALDFLCSIQGHIEKEADVPVSFIVTPGNHDCDFSLDSGARKMLIKNLLGPNPEPVDSSVIDTCVSVQKSFFEFRDTLENNPISDDKLWRTHSFQINEKTIMFDCLNISWVSQLHEPNGSLYFPVNSYKNNVDPNIHTRLIVLHHPLNWFNQTIYRSFRTHVRQLANIVISGHEHEGNVGVIQESASGSSAYIEGCVLQESSEQFYSSSFNVANLNLEENLFTTTKYIWDNTKYVEEEGSSWTESHDLPETKANPFPVSLALQETLDDPGGFFKHPGVVKLTLSDIYVYPDMKKVTSDQERNVITTKKLQTPGFISKGVLIESEEKYGSTSLLYQLFRHYHERGYVPLIIQGKDIKNQNEVKLNALIKRSVKYQYGKDYEGSYAQLPNAKKILLLDDFDDGPLKEAGTRIKLLCSLRKRFGYMVVTVSNMFEISEVLNSESSRPLMSLEHYKLQKFGYTLRSNLIQRWLSLGADGSMDEATFIARCDQSERLLDSVMTKAFIPSVPLYLLTLLQSIEAGRSSELKESSLGHYYYYLLTEGLEASGVKREMHTEVFQYASHLAWEFHAQNKRELSSLELKDFNQRFSDEWVTVDYSKRLDELIKARVLYRVGEDYAFRYPYIFYYLKGKYLSENSSNTCVQEHIVQCCKHLYVRDYANTILFLAHHTNDEFVLDSVAGGLNELFKTRSPITFNNDTMALADILENAPKLTYSGEKPVDHRQRRNAVQDEMDNGHDGLADSEEASDTSGLSLIAQITMLYKTTEILGQILKDQYSKIKRTRKVDLLENLFNGPLRAISEFYSFIENNPDALVKEIEGAIERKGDIKSESQRNTLAKQVVASLIQLVTFSLILKGSQAVNAESLLEDIDTVVKRNGTLAFKLLEACIYLDSPKSIPREKLKIIFEESKGDPVASKVLHIMVLNRLYMFKTSEHDMQWINNELKINLAAQHSIAYNEHSRRIIK